MSPRGNQKTTFAKLNREARLRERKSAKAARKVARQNGTAAPRHPEWDEAPKVPQFAPPSEPKRG